MPLVSIVVPVYNSEKYLNKCLKSIKSQTLNDFECILVDDGSIDSSVTICDSFAAEDSRFSVIHLKNGGVSRARNEGIKKAKGEYIGFVDSDDWIDTEMFEILYRDVKKYKAEISICNIYEDNAKNGFTEMNPVQAKICMLSDDGFRGYSVNKLVKRELFDFYLYDENLKCYEDLVLFFQLFSKCAKVIWDARPLYHYFRHEGSLSTNYIFDTSKQAGISRLKQLMADETDLTVIEAMSKYFFCYYLETAIDYISHRNVDAEEYQQVYAYVIENRKQIKECSIRQKVWMRIVLNDYLKKIYWRIKGVPSKR